ncbi:MAG: capsule assembly Wzi family protein [Bacteroidota bacterium]
MTARLARIWDLARAVTLAMAFAGAASAQSEGLLTIEGDLQRFLLRQHAAGHLDGLDVGALPLSAAEAQAALDSLAASGAALSPADRDRLRTFRGAEAGGVFGPRAPRWAYPDGRALVGAAGDGYAVTAEPALNLAGGPQYVERVAGGSDWITSYRLSRGVRAAGHAGRFFAEAVVTENQVLAPDGPRSFRTAPRLGYAVTSDDPDPVYDYMTSRSIVGYRDRFVEVRGGRDRNRLGFARGALLLSDFASEYDHAQVRLSVGPVSVQSLYARFLDPRERGQSDGDGVVSKRYGAFHRLAVRPASWLELEAFEAVILGDREGDNRDGFELAYLVPFTFFRAAERDLGSPDNVLLGGGAAVRPGGGVRLYGQALLDELTADRFFEDAWTNKWAFVVGAEVADPWVPGLGRLRDTDVRIEYARLRPYLYSHRAVATAAIHYDDVLGHPAGPNASDLSVRVAHRLGADVEVSLDTWYSVRGRNADSLNVGADPREPTTTRIPEPNPTLQGVRQRIAFADLRTSVRLLPGLYAGLSAQAAYLDDAETGRSGTLAPLAFLRWALSEPSPRY